MGKTIHMCVSVRGAIRRLTRSRAKMAHGMLHADGRTMTREEAIEALFDQLEQGRKVLPMGEPCEGFDYSGGGCPGHEGADDDWWPDEETP
jgi:hypothetical protein